MLRGAEYDYVIIGAGSAGCVLAMRLSADPACRVLVIEAGPRRAGFYAAIPAGVYRVYTDPRINWNYHSEAETGLNGRCIPVPRGKVLGGSSTINSMVYLRGQPADYDAWDAAGARGWRYADCLPYFRRSETSDQGPNLFRGDRGPLSVETGTLESPIFDAFLSSAQDAGYPLSPDLNGARHDGFGRLQCTRRKGRRCSAAAAYLFPAMTRANLSVRTDAQVSRILIEEGHARGVTFRSGSASETAFAAREVILCAGAINSPQLLMLSGVGSADHLRACGIPVVHDLPGVGENLQEHLDVMLRFETRKPLPLARLRYPWMRWKAGLEWLLTGSGVAASSIYEVGGFYRSEEGVGRSNLQVHVAPLCFEDGPGGFTLSDGYSIHISQLRPESRGTVRLRGPDPFSAPEVSFRFLASERDRRECRDGIHRLREIVRSGELGGLTGSEIAPGSEQSTDGDLDRFVRETAETEFHPSCTCRMGQNEGAVVDPALRVHGLSGLRVVDASVMPNVVSANLNGPTIMIAEKAADLILGNASLPPADLERGARPASHQPRSFTK